MLREFHRNWCLLGKLLQPLLSWNCLLNLKLYTPSTINTDYLYILAVTIICSCLPYLVHLKEKIENFSLFKVSFFLQCSKMQFITFQKFHIQTCFSQFLWFFSLKCWFKGQIISRIDLSLPNAYKLMCFDRNINGNT